MTTKFWLIFISCLLLIAMLPSLPYAYYQLLRLVVFCAAAVVSWKFYQSELPSWMLVFLLVAILFNPLIPIFLTRDVWVPIDFIVACLFVLAANASKGGE